jgi:hypothetical protein
MYRKIGAWAAAGLLSLVLAAPLAYGQDTVRLGGSGDAKATTLAYDGQVDTVLTRGVRSGHGFHHPFHSHFFGHSHFIGHSHFFGHNHFIGRGFYGRGFYGGNFGWYRPWYYASWYYPSYYYPTYYYPSYYPCYSSYYTSTYAYYPVSADVASAVPARTYRPIYVSPERETLPPPINGSQPPTGNGTYPYDGGPAVPVPLPGKSDPLPMKQQPAPKIVPGDGRLVYLPATPAASTTGGSSFAYPAYGETQTTNFATDRVGVTAQAKK